LSANNSDVETFGFITNSLNSWFFIQLVNSQIGYALELQIFW